MASSLSTIDRSRFRTWCATYPPKGGAEALATVTEDDGGFDVSVAAVGWALKRHGAPAPGVPRRRPSRGARPGPMLWPPSCSAREVARQVARAGGRGAC